MKNESTNKKISDEAVIQNLRMFLKQFLVNDTYHTLEGFARRMDMSSRELGRYLRGEHKPRKSTITKWANMLGVDYEYMTTLHGKYINYPFDRYVKPKPNGHHITMREVRRSYDAMIDDYETMAREGIVDYNKNIIDMIERHKP